METIKKIELLKTGLSRLDEYYSKFDKPSNDNELKIRMEGRNVNAAITEIISDLKELNSYGGIAQLIKFASGEEKQQELF